MKFLTLLTNPPEEIKPILAKSESVFGVNYKVIDLDPKVIDLDAQLCVIQNSGMTHWNYIEDEGNE